MKEIGSILWRLSIKDKIVYFPSTLFLWLWQESLFWVLSNLSQIGKFLFFLVIPQYYLTAKAQFLAARHSFVVWFPYFSTEGEQSKFLYIQKRSSLWCIHYYEYTGYFCPRLEPNFLSIYGWCKTVSFESNQKRIKQISGNFKRLRRGRGEREQCFKKLRCIHFGNLVFMGQLPLNENN